MRRHLVTTALAAALGTVLFAGAACTNAGTDGDSNGSNLSADAQTACDEYSEIVNRWSKDFGAVMGDIGQAEANGDEDYQDAAVESMRDLFAAASDGLREQAGATTDQELSDGLSQAADGMAEIADQIESFDDVEEASGMMNEGQFAEGGMKVNTICAG